MHQVLLELPKVEVAAGEADTTSWLRGFQLSWPGYPLDPLTSYLYTRLLRDLRVYQPPSAEQVQAWEAQLIQLDPQLVAWTQMTDLSLPAISMELHRRSLIRYDNVFYFQRTTDEELSPTHFRTAIRDCLGRFHPHVKEIMKLTQSYATKDNVPVRYTALLLAE